MNTLFRGKPYDTLLLLLKLNFLARLAHPIFGDDEHSPNILKYITLIRSVKNLCKHLNLLLLKAIIGYIGETVNLAVLEDSAWKSP